MILFILIALFTQIDERQKELDQLKEKLTSVRTEIKQLEKEKVGTLAHIEKIDEGITLTIKYIDELTSQMSKEQQNVDQLTRNIAQDTVLQTGNRVLFEIPAPDSLILILPADTRQG
jgi:septal ring factor EnvC (AmiA/AmiB activator)